MIPLLAADSGRMAEAQRTRPGGAPTGARARVALLGAVIGGSLDRAMDVAATLELRGFAAARLEIAKSSIGRRPSRRLRTSCLWGLPGSTGRLTSGFAGRSISPRVSRPVRP
jgi:energy-coupling factor transporter transmembrane protein EcfT